MARAAEAVQAEEVDVVEDRAVRGKAALHTPRSTLSTRHGPEFPVQQRFGVAGCAVQPRCACMHGMPSIHPHQPWGCEKGRREPEEWGRNGVTPRNHVSELLTNSLT